MPMMLNALKVPSAAMIALSNGQNQEKKSGIVGGDPRCKKLKLKKKLGERCMLNFISNARE